MAGIRIALLACFLLIAAFAAALVLGAAGIRIDWEKAALPGLACGAAACLLAMRVRGRWLALSVALFSSAAVGLAGPSIGFLFLFGLASGLGGSAAMIGAWSDPGTNGVAMQTATLLALAALTLFFFVSQAWAVARAWIAWRLAAPGRS